MTCIIDAREHYFSLQPTVEGILDEIGAGIEVYPVCPARISGKLSGAGMNWGQGVAVSGY